MNDRYQKNKIHINDQQQQIIKKFHILIAGCGIGSYIAECLLRLGFETITIIDGDFVELSNLNRQNYTMDDIKFLKVDAIKSRLLSINPDADINIGAY